MYRPHCIIINSLSLYICTIRIYNGLIFPFFDIYIDGDLPFDPGLLTISEVPSRVTLVLIDDPTKKSWKELEEKYRGVFPIFINNIRASRKNRSIERPSVRSNHYPRSIVEGRRIIIITWRYNNGKKKSTHTYSKKGLLFVVCGPLEP